MVESDALPMPKEAAQYAPVASASKQRADDSLVGVDDACTGFGWTISGFASVRHFQSPAACTHLPSPRLLLARAQKAIMSIIFTIAPIMLTAAARGYDDTGIFRSERSTLELSGLYSGVPLIHESVTHPSMQAPLVRATWTASSQAQMLRVSEGEEAKSASGLAPGLAIRLTSAPRGAAP